MATTESTETEFSLQKALFRLAESYRQLDISIRRYALTILLPAVVAAVVLPTGALLLGGGILLALPVALFGLFLIFAALLYPQIRQSRQKKEVRGKFHLFLTHVTVLSLANIDRIDIFRRIAAIEEYDALASETAEMVALVDAMNRSLDDASRQVAKTTSSELLSDFLERLSYTVGAGKKIEEFLTTEQEEIMNSFVIRYEASLNQLDVLSDLYISMMIAVAFLLVFVSIIPIFIGIPALLLILAVVMGFITIQIIFTILINAIAPDDPLWFSSGNDQGPISRVRRSLLVGAALTAVTVVLALLGLAGVFGSLLPRPLWLGVAVTPLALPGIRMRQESKRVQKRDEEFPSFIRSLGSVEGVKQSSTANVLETLRKKEFGNLTESIERLYRRLNTRVDSRESWQLFAGETGSYLIHKFSDMYVTGRRMGGDPEQLGEIISANFEAVMRVRKKRRQAARTFLGLLYGITAAVTFTAFVGLGITEQMVSIAPTDQLQGELAAAGSLFNVANFNAAAIEAALFVFILTNAVLSAVAIRMIDRRHLISGLSHVVALTWIGALVAVGTQAVIGSIISV
jgi:flagellar protein FlaJ